MTFRRSAAYMNALVKIANQKAGLENIVRVEKYKHELETRRAEDLNRVYKVLEASAKQGAVRIQNWELTPKDIRNLLFEDSEIKRYLQSNGFSYSNNAVEWYGAPLPEELK